MKASPRLCSVLARSLVLAASLVAVGCHHGQVQQQWPTGAFPKELRKANLPEYVVEPPDILLVDAVRVVPKPPYKIEPLDVLLIQVLGTLPDAPIAGNYGVEPDGSVNLGLPYGSVNLAGLTLEKAKTAVEDHLKQILREPQVSVSLAQSRAMQQIAGEHLVRPDGTVSLGTYGSVHVAGRTLREARAAIEEKLGQHLQDPEVSVDVFSYNSKVYYVITDGGGSGQQIVRLPITGNETVLDAVAAVGGLSSVSAKKVWIARPNRRQDGRALTLPVDWRGVAEQGIASTNYQILPGDRVFVHSDPLISLDTLVAKVTAPFMRAIGAASFTYIFLRQANFGVSGGTGTSTGIGGI